jgi:DNA-binding transcriptional LysR family regulator
MILDKKMRVFLVTADAGSFSRAARKLSISQSVVSFHIKALEEELGVSLFRRQGRSISLTEEGELLFEQGRKLAQEARKLEDAFSAASEEIAQRIHIAGDALTCAFTLPWTLAAFRESHQDVVFTYEHLEERELTERLVAGELDVGLVGHPVQHRKLATHACFQDEIVLVAAADSALDELKKVEGLSSVPLIWATGDRGLELLLGRGLPEAGVQLKDLNVFMEINDLPILKTFVRAGVGMAFLPLLTVVDETRFGLLKLIETSLTLTRTNFLVYRRDRTQRRVVTALVEFVENRDWQPVLDAQGRGDTQPDRDQP